MPTRIPHQWWIEFTPQSQDDFDQVDKRDRIKILRRLEALCKADNPLSLLQKLEGREAWKFREGDWRVFVSLDVAAVVRFDYSYKGVLRVIAVRRHHTGY